jgi:hypothetical protein
MSLTGHVIWWRVQVKEVQVVVYEAWDGKRFDTVAQAREYEGKALHKRLANRSPEDIQAAIEGKDGDLAEAFERLGKVIRDGRKKRGETKWPPARQKAQAAANEPVRESAA